MMRGQMAMWILTKFALLFFIMSLFAIIFIFEQNARSQTCLTQTQRIANGITNRLSQILDSPVEDEQRSFPFELGLPLGGGDVARYKVNLTNRVTNPEPGDTTIKGRLIVDVIPANVKNCIGSGVVSYSGRNVELFSLPERTSTKTLNAFKDKTITLSPSELDEGIRSYYLTMIKCGEKKFNGQKYMFIQDCSQKDFNKCFTFTQDDPESNINAKCGFGNAD
ncbi:MAG: hypothetical protein AABX01_00460 [Candidatus Micrarchaeota archaeon]